MFIRFRVCNTFRKHWTRSKCNYRGYGKNSLVLQLRKHITHLLVSSISNQVIHFYVYVSFHNMFSTLAGVWKKNTRSTCRRANSFPAVALTNTFAKARASSTLNSRENVPKIIPGAKRVVIKIPSSLLVPATARGEFCVPRTPTDVFSPQPAPSHAIVIVPTVTR